jgi:hypothetical protein
MPCVKETTHKHMMLLTATGNACSMAVTVTWKVLNVPFITFTSCRHTSATTWRAGELVSWCVGYIRLAGS